MGGRLRLFSFGDTFPNYIIQYTPGNIHCKEKNLKKYRALITHLGGFACPAMSESKTPMQAYPPDSLTAGMNGLRRIE